MFARCGRTYSAKEKRGARMKSSCCGAELKLAQEYVSEANAYIETDIICDECREFCQEIPDDIMSKKEMLYEIEPYIEFLSHENGVGMINFERLFYILKSIREHLK